MSIRNVLGTSIAVARRGWRPIVLAAAVLLAGLWGSTVARAEAADDILSAVVRIEVKVTPGARSAATLGTERRGNGVVIDGDGLILTIGYLILEASDIEVTGPQGKKVSATVVGYDNESGFGLIRTAIKLPVKPIELGDSADLAERQRVMIAGFGGAGAAHPALVVSRRTFAGYWEYLLEDAIFTAPPYSEFGGAALIAPDGRLVGIGSLIVSDALKGDRSLPGNMFVPIDRLKPILAEMVRFGRPQAPPRPWLGITSEEHRGRVFIVRVAPDSPASKAGVKPGDILLSVAGAPVTTLEGLYRRLWSVGPAGVEVPLSVLQGVEVNRMAIKSVDRNTLFKLNPTY